MNKYLLKGVPNILLCVLFHLAAFSQERKMSGEGAWTDYTIPFSQLGSPTSLTNVTIQEFSNNNSLIYIDDFGLF
jgi:hypothetical protein